MCLDDDAKRIVRFCEIRAGRECHGQRSIQSGGARQRSIERGPRRMPEARGDVTVGSQQIGRARLGVITSACEMIAISKAALAADPYQSDTVRRVDGAAIAEGKAAEPLALI